jgi:hypothetical protein
LLRCWRSSRRAAFSRAHAVLGFALLAPQGCRGEAAQRQVKGAKKNESAAPFSSSCLNSKPIFGTYICSPWSLFCSIFFLPPGSWYYRAPGLPGRAGLVVPGTPVSSRSPRSFPISRPVSRPQVFSRRAFHISYRSVPEIETRAH